MGIQTSRRKKLAEENQLAQGRDGSLWIPFDVEATTDRIDRQHGQNGVSGRRN
jgi:hypothetical protein